MVNNEKSGKSLILLAIVIVVMSFALYFVSRFFNQKMDKATEEAFKLNVYEYNLEIEEYKTELAQTIGYDENSFYAYGVDLQNVIPNIIETDMSKFKIEQGKLIYIGTDENERKWTNEVKI